MGASASWLHFLSVYHWHPINIQAAHRGFMGSCLVWLSVLDHAVSLEPLSVVTFGSGIFSPSCCLGQSALLLPSKLSKSPDGSTFAICFLKAQEL